MNVRTRDGVVHGEKTVEGAIARLQQIKKSKVKDDEIGEF